MYVCICAYKDLYVRGSGSMNLAIWDGNSTKFSYANQFFLE